MAKKRVKRQGLTRHVVSSTPKLKNLQYSSAQCGQCKRRDGVEKACLSRATRRKAQAQGGGFNPHPSYPPPPSGLAYSKLCPPPSTLPVVARCMHLSLKGKGSADLVGSLAEILRVKGGAEAEGDARAELDIVGERCDAAVVDLGLLVIVSLG
jgi:hypothetical protein